MCLAAPVLAAGRGDDPHRIDLAELPRSAQAGFASVTALLEEFLDSQLANGSTPLRPQAPRAGRVTVQLRANAARLPSAQELESRPAAGLTGA